MASFLREKVSRNKIRFREDGFDLDLTYITPRIVAMGFPSEKVEGFYRNPIGEVQRFWDKRHKELYKLYNLCAERSYDPAKFHGRVTTYPFEDHNAPPVQLIVDCCNDVHDWLMKDEKNVVGINCKAGKGRTGLIICCYLMHAGICKNADDAMLFYGTRRTKDGKGVTIASQKRYVRYYEQVLKAGRVPDPRMLKLKKITVNTIPNFSGDPCATVILKNKEVGSTDAIKIPKGATSYDIPADVPVIGDVKLQLDVKKGKSIQHTCHIWFNTGFVDSSNTVHFDKHEIDVASKDKKNAHFKPDFSIDLEFEDINVDTSAMSSTVASPRRDGVEGADTPKKTKKSSTKSKDKKGKKDGSEEVDDSLETPKSSKKDKKKDKGSSPKEVPTVESTQDSKSKKEKKDKPEENVVASFAPPSGDEFQQKRKRRQSFYEVDEELENNEDLSDSAIEEKELEEYFEPESVDEDDKEAESPKVVKSEKSSSGKSDSDVEEETDDSTRTKKQVDASDSSQASDTKEKSDSQPEKTPSKSIAISTTSSSSRRGLSSGSSAPSEQPTATEPASESPKPKKEKKDKDTKNGSDSPSSKKRK